MNCSVCAALLPPGVSYCPNCGTPTPAFYSSAGVAPHAPTVVSSPDGSPAPPPSPESGRRPPYGAVPPSPYSTPPATPYNPYSASPLPPPPPPPRHRGNRIGLLIGLVLLVVVIVVGGAVALLRPRMQSSSSPSSQSVTPAQATATAQGHAAATVTSQLTATAQAHATATASVIAANPNPYPPGGGRLALYDPLRDNSQGYSWQTGTYSDGACVFSGGAFQVSTPKTYMDYFCAAEANNFSNFAFEVQATIRKGDCAGLIFRAAASGGKLYLFRVCQSGSYNLYLYRGYSGVNSKVVVSGSSSAITTGLNQSNVLAVVAQGNTLDLYVNKQKIASASDSTYSHGQVAVVADALNDPTEVAFSNAKVWTL